MVRINFKVKFCQITSNISCFTRRQGKLIWLVFICFSFLIEFVFSLSRESCQKKLVWGVFIFTSSKIKQTEFSCLVLLKPPSRDSAGVRVLPAATGFMLYSYIFMHLNQCWQQLWPVRFKKKKFPASRDGAKLSLCRWAHYASLHIQIQPAKPGWALISQLSEREWDFTF